MRGHPSIYLLAAAFAAACFSASAAPALPSTADVPNENAFSYAGYGDNEHGHYKVYFYSLTTPDQYLKHLLIWVRIDWANPQVSGSNHYRSELLLFHIDCKATTYTISSRLWLNQDQKALRRSDVAPADYKYEAMPTPSHYTFVKGKSSTELAAASHLMDGCDPPD